MIALIAARELRSLLSMPSTWWVLAGLQFMLAWIFLTRLDAFLEIQPQLAQIANAPGVTASIARDVCNVAALLLMMLTPLFTMRVIAEERRNQTLTLLLSSPVSSAQIVLGKFVGLMGFLLLLMSTTPLMLLSLQLGTTLDFGLLCSNLFGLILLASCYAAVGLYVSSLTAQPIIAAITTLGVLLGSWLADMSSSALDSPWHQVSPLYHFQNFSNGLLDTGDASFFVLVSGVCLLLAMQRLNAHRLQK